MFLKNLLQLLIQKPSITPEDAGCQLLLAEYLSNHGFHIRHLPFGDVHNLWAVHGDGDPILCYCGHTDIVPPGELSQWTFPPFELTESEGFFYGRGTQDMKGPLSAAICAAIDYVNAFPQHPGSLAFLVTSDEEGQALNGTEKVLQQLNEEGIQIKYCLVGEPSCEMELGDVLKCGRRGSLCGKVTIFGKQGHVAYAEKTLNPIPILSQIVLGSKKIEWLKNHSNFPNTQLQWTNLQAGQGITNVIPGKASAQFNIRFSPCYTVEEIKKTLSSCFEAYIPPEWEMKIEFASRPALPFWRPDPFFIEKVQASIFEVTKRHAEIKTNGGTSDGRFFAAAGTSVIEFGCKNDTIHAINERVSIKDLEALKEVYLKIFTHMFTI